MPMSFIKNPSDEKVEWLIDQSDQNTANWLRDLECGDCYYWPAESTSHEKMADQLQLKKYEKGFAI